MAGMGNGPGTAPRATSTLGCDMLGLLGILGALVAGLALDSGSDSPSEGREAEDAPDDEEWGVSSAFFDMGALDEDGPPDDGPGSG